MAKKKPDDAAAEAERRFKADLKAGTLGSFYIICGEEAFLRSHYVELATKNSPTARRASLTSTAFPPTTARRRRWLTRSTPCP